MVQQQQTSVAQLEQSFLDCYDKNADAILRHCIFRVYDRERALEIMQEAFTRTWKQITGGAKILNIRAFVYRVANNLIIDESRKKKSVSLDLLQESGFDPASEVDEEYKIAEHIDAEQILQVLERVEEKYRKVLIMRYVDALTPREIAEILEETPNVISVRIHRAVKQLRSILIYEQKL